MPLRAVYVDVLFAVNLAINYLLLLSTARFCGVYVRRRRIAAGAAFGALCAVPLYFASPGVPLSLLIKLCLCAAVTAVVFGKQGRGVFLRLCLSFTVISFVFAGGTAALAWIGGTGGVSVSGGVPYFRISLGMLAAAAVLAYAILALTGSARGSARQKSADIVIRMGGRSVRLRALSDSGNMLREPISGKPVIVVPAAAAASLFTGAEAQILAEAGAADVFDAYSRLTAAHAGRFRLAPYKTAGGSGMMIVLRPDAVTVDGRRTDKYLVGISPEEIDAGAGCRAVIGL